MTIESKKLDAEWWAYTKMPAKGNSDCLTTASRPAALEGVFQSALSVEPPMSRPAAYSLWSSCRRRRLVIRQGTQGTLSTPLPRDREDIEVTREPQNTSRPAGTLEFFVPVTIPALRRVMQGTDRLIWLLAGDSPLSLDCPKSASAGCFEGIQQRLQAAHRRDGDVFVRSAAPQTSLRELFDHFEERIGRFSPQVAMIFCGPHELQSQFGDSLAFERMFHRLIRRIRDAGAIPVINTPLYSFPLDRLEHSDELIRLEAIRACTEESAAFLVDHWEFWERGANSSWLIPGTATPSEAGIQAISDEICRVLQLLPEGSVAATPVLPAKSG